MAEGFARVYGSDVLIAKSAGLYPANTIAPLTRAVMFEKNVDLGDGFPKPLDMVTPDGVDLIVNMSGSKLPPKITIEVEDWDVRDPIGESEHVYRQVRDEIEQRVMRLILKLRTQGKATPALKRS